MFEFFPDDFHLARKTIRGKLRPLCRNLPESLRAVILYYEAQQAHHENEWWDKFHEEWDRLAERQE